MSWQEVKKLKRKFAWCASVDGSQQSGVVQAFVHVIAPARRRAAEQREVANAEPVLRNLPQRLFRGPPPERVETAKRDRPRARPPGRLSALIVVVVEVSHDQFAHGAID